MKKIDVKIVKLEPLRMVSIYGFGEHPEDEAHSKLLTWIKDNNITFEPGKSRIFGYNNPNPSAGSTKYGYEFLVSVGYEVETGDNVSLVDFPGGLYAAAYIDIQSGEELPAYWQAINNWCENSEYDFGQHQWLEEHSFEIHPIAIFLPIKE